MAKSTEGKSKRSAAGRKSPYLCVDLFAGAGGFSVAAKRVGLRVVAAVEKDRQACATYRHNLVRPGEAKLYEKDITELNPKDILKECFSANDRCDLVLGGPPCQGFSVHRFKDAGKGDPRNKLIHRYFEFVSVLRPRLFLLENVPGILWSRHSFVLRQFYAEASKAGYKVMEPEVLDARDFGVPQRRKRIFILGVRKDVLIQADWTPRRTHGSPSARIKEPKLKEWLSCASVFRRRLRMKDPNNIHMNHSEKMVEVFKKTPANGGSRVDAGRILPCHRNHDGHKDVYGRIDPRKPGPTMTTACINPSKGRFLHPTKHHGITLRHAARLQTFPEGFVFKGGLMAGGVQVGNAVPIKLGAALLKQLRAILSADDIAKERNRARAELKWLEAAE